jgi:hypothetical protein
MTPNLLELNIPDLHESNPKKAEPEAKKVFASRPRISPKYPVIEASRLSLKTAILSF